MHKPGCMAGKINTAGQSKPGKAESGDAGAQCLCNNFMFYPKDSGRLEKCYKRERSIVLQDWLLSKNEEGANEKAGNEKQE